MKSTAKFMGSILVSIFIIVIFTGLGALIDLPIVGFIIGIVVAIIASCSINDKKELLGTQNKDSNLKANKVNEEKSNGELEGFRDMMNADKTAQEKERQQPSLKKCPQCGKNMPITAKFCSNCGHKF